MAKQLKKTGGASKTGGVSQVFSLKASEAQKVMLAGDFTQWQKEPISLQRGEDGIWRATVQLEPGEHRYRFLVDGEWRDDPRCLDYEPNPFGTINAIITVG